MRASGFMLFFVYFFFQLGALSLPNSRDVLFKSKKFFYRIGTHTVPLYSCVTMLIYTETHRCIYIQVKKWLPQWRQSIRDSDGRPRELCFSITPGFGLFSCTKEEAARGDGGGSLLQPRDLLFSLARSFFLFSCPEEKRIPRETSGLFEWTLRYKCMCIHMEKPSKRRLQTARVTCQTY